MGNKKKNKAAEFRRPAQGVFVIREEYEAEKNKLIEQWRDKPLQTTYVEKLKISPSQPAEKAAHANSPLPPIPASSMEEKRALFMLDEELQGGINRIVGNFITANDELGKDTVTPEIKAIHQRIEAGENTHITYADQWEIGLPHLRSLIMWVRNYGKEKEQNERNGTHFHTMADNLEMKLAPIYEKCRLQAVYGGTISELMDHMVKEGIGQINSPDIELVAKKAIQPLPEDACEQLARLKDTVCAGKRPGYEETSLFTQYPGLANCYALPDKVFLALPHIFNKLVRHIDLNPTDRQHFEKFANAALSHPPLSAEEEQTFKSSPRFSSFLMLADMVGQRRFGSLVEMAQTLAGIQLEQGGHSKGAIEAYQEYAFGALAGENYVIQSAENHQCALDGFKTALKQFKEEAGELFTGTFDRPARPDGDYMKTAISEIRPLADTQKPPMYQTIIRGAPNKTVRRLEEDMLTSFSGYKSNDDLALFIFKSQFEPIADELMQHVSTQQNYENISQSHRYLIRGMKSLRNATERTIDAFKNAEFDILAVQSTEPNMRPHFTNAHYKDFREKMDIRTQDYLRQLEHRIEVLDGVHAHLHRAQDGKPMGAYAQLAISADTITDAMETLIEKMEERKPLLDAYAQRKKDTIGAGSPGSF